MILISYSAIYAIKRYFIFVVEEIFERFFRVAESMGMNRSEAIRMAMEMFISMGEESSYTRRMRGVVKSRFFLKELRGIYRESK